MRQDGVDTCYGFCSSYLEAPTHGSEATETQAGTVGCRVRRLQCLLPTDAASLNLSPNAAFKDASCKSAKP